MYFEISYLDCVKLPALKIYEIKFRVRTLFQKNKKSISGVFVF